MELDSGSIRIDGLDISRMGVRQLRSKMAIIPQVSSGWLLKTQLPEIAASDG